MTSPSIGCAATFRDEHNAMPGFLEAASQFFDHIFLVDCSVDLSPSTDGSLDIIRKWGLPDPPRWSLADGFGAVRSQLIHSSPTDWTVIMDLDERMYKFAPLLTCEGDEAYPAVEKPSLNVRLAGEPYNQRACLNEMVELAESTGKNAIRFCRRHWFSFNFAQPTQNWTKIRDYQLRCMKGRAGVGYRSDTRMHEAAHDFINNRDPEYLADDDMRGPFLDHYHCFFKSMEPEQRAEAIRTYDALHFSDVHTPIPKR